MNQSYREEQSIVVVYIFNYKDSVTSSKNRNERGKWTEKKTRALISPPLKGVGQR